MESGPTANREDAYGRAPSAQASNSASGEPAASDVNLLDGDRRAPATPSSAAPSIGDEIGGVDNDQWDVPPGWHVTWPDPPSARDERIQHILGLCAAGCAFAIASSLVLWLWSSSDTADIDANRGMATFAAAAGDPDGDESTAPNPARLAPGARASAGAGLADSSEDARAPEQHDGLESVARSSIELDSAPDRRRTSGLLVVSDPPGARVTINGVGYGATPARVPYPPTGAKRIRVTMDGFQSEERYFGPETTMSPATLRVVMHERQSKRYRTANISAIGAAAQQR